MNEKMIRKYANMLATVGINVQKGQKKTKFSKLQNAKKP